ncbi:MAG TPA: hypothetical protein VM115_10260 [Vicinamibacterales bacterium]|nr:hypothetical protein [Vicinamibacterales bacterium]
MRALLAGAVVAAACACGSDQPQRRASGCQQVGAPLFLQAVPEASGVASAGGVLWTHNDSGAAVLYSIDASGRAMPVAVHGADVIDGEDLTAAPCADPANAAAGEGCLYIADIGDNQESRDRITVYVVPVPAPGSASAKVTGAIHVRYPDRPHDAEALLITTAGTFIITKDLPARVYRFAAASDPRQPPTLTLSRTLNETVRITGAAGSSDGRWVALRSNRMLLLYTLDDFLNGRNPARIDLSRFNEPQGEGVTFGTPGDLYVVSEGGGRNAAGVLTRIDCAPLR